jgi:SAM-dependent methyltransferase
MERDLEIVRELRELADPKTAEPLQFQNLLTGSLYLPLYQLARRHAKPGMSVLDWGSGNGHFSYFLLRAGLNVTAFNLSSHRNPLENLLKTRFAGRYRMCYGDANDPVTLPFADQSFDMVVSIGVLEHVRETGGNEVASLQELNRVLRPGGRFLCGMLPKRYSWIEFLVRNFSRGKYQHVYRYTARDIHGMLERSGFELIELGTHGFLPRTILNRPALAGVTNRVRVATLFNSADRLLVQSLPPVAQNFMLCASKPSPGPDRRAERAPSLVEEAGQAQSASRSP